MADVWTPERYGAPLACMVRVWPGEEHNPLVIWPYEEEDNGLVCVWQPIGQHGAGSLRPDGTRPATEAEARDALQRWQAEHPEDRPPPEAWRVLKRAPSWSQRRAHRAKAKRAEGELCRLQYLDSMGWHDVADCPAAPRAELEREQAAREAFNRTAGVSRSYRIAPAG